jgi:hypothetical protein
MMMQMVGAFGEFERAMLRERTKLGLESARREGRIGGRRPKLSPQQQAEVRTLFKVTQLPSRGCWRGLTPDNLQNDIYVDKRHNVLANVGDLLPDLESVYKDIHAHPELSMQENRTAGIGADRLRTAGYDVTTGIGKTGVVGLLRNGKGPVVMLRADMDALPVQEATELPYASKVTASDSTGKTVPVMPHAVMTCM